jgi:hypothetical protein
MKTFVRGFGLLALATTLATGCGYGGDTPRTGEQPADRPPAASPPTAPNDRAVTPPPPAEQTPAPADQPPATTPSPVPPSGGTR